MAHELEIRDGKASMMYVGGKPWHGLGTELDHPATAAEAIRAARLDYRVVRRPVYAMTRGGLVPIPGRYAIVRTPSSGAGETIFGVVGAGYRPLQNVDAFRFFDTIVGSGQAIYHTAGVLGQGERIWILARLPDDIRVVGDDVAEKYLLLSNSHDGSSSVQIKFTPIRVVCQNTLTMALRDGPTVRILHRRSLQRELDRAQETLGIIRKRFDELEVGFRALARVSVNEERLAEYLARIFPDPADPLDEPGRLRAGRDRRWSRHLFEDGRGQSLPQVRGTLWAAYNGVTEYVDHRVLFGRNGRPLPEDRRLGSVWFGEGYRIKARAYREAIGLAEAWKN
jgi:phage/plasmid-like protein (TIGR03299 family)